MALPSASSKSCSDQLWALASCAMLCTVGGCASAAPYARGTFEPAPWTSDGDASFTGTSFRETSSTETSFADASAGERARGGESEVIEEAMTPLPSRSAAPSRGVRGSIIEAAEPASTTRAPIDLPESVATPAARMVIYSARMEIVVADVERARRHMLSLVAQAGGHLQSRTRDTIVVRVPSAKFQALSEQARTLGRMIDENMQARDVTRQVFELSLRIDNAEKARLRLLEILERGGKLEHVLRLEKELRRVTEEIELLKGKRRQLQGEAAFSTLKLRLLPHAPAPIAFVRRKMSPFAWVRAIGPEQVLSMSLAPDDIPDLLPAAIVVPRTFVTLEEGPFEVRAVSAEGARVWLRTQSIADADLDFWRRALLEEMKHVRGYTVLESEIYQTAEGQQILEIVAELHLAGEPQRYQLLVSARSLPLLGSWVQTVEHLGATEAFADRALQVRESVLGPDAKKTNPSESDKSKPLALLEG